MCRMWEEGLFFLRGKTEDVSRMAMNNNKIFVLTKLFEIPGGAVDVYDSDGQFTILRFGEETLNYPQSRHLFYKRRPSCCFG